MCEIQRREAEVAAAEKSVAAIEMKAVGMLAQRDLAGARNELQADSDSRLRRAARAALKADVLGLAAELNRGAGDKNQGISPAEQADMVSLIKRLEPLSPITDPLTAPQLNGRWQLVYTTSASILGINKLVRPVGPIHQTLDVPNLSARNDEVVRLPLGLRMRRFVKADITPDMEIKSKVTVRFRKFGLGPLRIPAPKRAVGELDTTYLDENLRISRGDKGNIFVLFKDDPPQAISRG
jgi:hypothetical protein